MLWATAALLLVASVVGQAPLRITGRTLSDTAAPVAGAEVELRRPDADAVVARDTSDAAGAFTLEVRERGDYVVTVRRPGFYTLEHLAVAVDGDASLSLTLSPVREHLESLDVTSRGDPVGLTQNASEKSLSGAEAMTIPFTGSHNVKNALRTLPGVVQDAVNDVHIDGAREHQTLFVLDGFNIGDPLSGRFDPRVSVEAVQSMTVRAGVYAAEHGKNSGGVIELTTQAGGDRLRFGATDFVPTIAREHGLHVQDWTPRVSVSGPIARGRAWFANSFIGEYDQSFVKELPEGANSMSRRRLSEHLRTQVNLAPSNVVQIGGLGSGGRDRRLGLTPLDPVSTTRNQRSRVWFASIRDQHYFHSGTVVETGYAYTRTSLRLTPKGSEPYISTPEGRSGNYYYSGRQRSTRDQGIVNLYLPALTFGGSHQIKAGLDVDRVSYWQDATRGRIELRDKIGTPIRSVSYFGSGVSFTTNREVSAFVQDAWSLHPRLVLQVGLRSDWDSLTRDWTASPRVTLAWAPRADDATKLSAGFAVTHDAALLQLFAIANDQVPVSVYHPPYGSGAPLASRFQVDEGLSSPQYRTWMAALDRRLPAGLFLHAQATSRRGRNGLAFFGVPLRDDNTLQELANLRTDRYDAAEISVRQRFGHEYGWLAGYTRSSVRSNAVVDASPDNYYVAADNSGPLPWDTPHRVIGWAYFPTFRPKWSGSCLFEYRTGFPYSAVDSAGFVAGSAGAYRFPDYFDLTIGVERRTRLFGQTWSLRASINNVTNHHNPTTVNAVVEAPEFGTFYGGSGRALTGRVRWLGR